MKRIFIVHGWGGSPERDWMPWAKKVLEERGFDVHVPALPNPKYPKIGVWVPFLAKEIGKIDENTIFVGHSLGCQTILRYFETLPERTKGSDVVLIAGFTTLTPAGVGSREEEKIIRPWLDAPLDFQKARKVGKSYIAIFSDNDPYVPCKENGEIFKKKLGAKIIMEHKKGHFSQEDGVKELPILLKIIESL